MNTGRWRDGWEERDGREGILSSGDRWWDRWESIIGKRMDRHRKASVKSGKMGNNTSRAKQMQG